MREGLDHMISRWVIGAALPFMAGGGCFDGIVVYNDIAHALDVRSQLAYATNGLQMKTRIQGNPFDMPRESLEGVVTTAMRGANPGPAVTFSTDPAAKTLTPYHVVVRFDAPAWLGGKELCGGNAQSGESSSSGKIRITAAFCFGEQVLSEVQVDAANVAGPSDPRFKSVIQQMTMFLFPPDDPQFGNRPRLL